MCGIAGIVAPDVRQHRATLERMVATLRHRGPDGAGNRFFRNCALGHARLSIVDLTTGDQPMLSADNQVAVTFNGEIYGYREIKNELDSYKFQTTSDTEVILALYHRYGKNLALHLPGMFAFAGWDEHQQTLFAARDRFGEKPFYYAWGQHGEFLFASEIKSLIATNLFKPKIDKAALTHYLRHLYVHPHQTIYSNVFTLPPASCLHLEKGQLSVRRYWELPATQEPISTEDAVVEFRRLFEQAVSKQLVADVPVGAFLSGGHDSSSVVAAASRHCSQLKTYSFGFRDSVNELPYAKEIAHLYGTEHVELEDQRADISELLIEMANIYDEPFADSSNIPTYLISQAARRYGKVILTGDGGDELLGGYEFWYRPLWGMGQSNSDGLNSASLIRLGTRICSRLGLLMPRHWADIYRGAELRKRYASVAQAHAEQNSYFSDDELCQLGVCDKNFPHSAASELNFDTDTVDDAMRMDLSNYMPGDILVKTDRASMAHGLELRAPFLDVDFASFCVSLPSRLKITAKEDKWILRRCYSDSWTESVRTRRKCGFGAPVDQWLKRNSVASLKNKILNNPAHALFSLIPFGASRTFAAKDNYQTWILLVLGLWLQHGGEDGL